MLDFGFYNMDCMDGMKEFPDKYFELAIVDPPYGIGETGDRSTRAQKTDRWKNPKAKHYEIKDWDNRPPTAEYFTELIRVSQNQIIWGANHFIENIQNANSSCWIFWDKKNGNTDFADGELAWASFKTAVRKFEWLWNGFQKQQPEHRIHPTQKPVALYEWLLNKYANKGDKILDTHVGSASSLIACHKLGFSFVGFELDLDYYKQASERLDSYQRQTNLLDLL